MSQHSGSPIDNASVEALDELAAEGTPIPERSDGYPTDWHDRRQYVYERDEYQCRNCGATVRDSFQTSQDTVSTRCASREDQELHCHHVVPKGQGGSHRTDNLITLCSECHDAVHPDVPIDGSTVDTATEQVSSDDRQSVLETLYIQSEMSIEQLEQYAEILERTPIDDAAEDEPEPGTHYESAQQELYAFVSVGAMFMLLAIPAAMVSPWIAALSAVGLILFGVYHGQIS